VTLRYFKSINTGDISDGNSVTKSWTPDSDVKIKYLFISDRNKTDLAASQVWFEFGSGNVLTKDYVPASILGNSVLTAVPLDVEVKKGSKITIKVTNGEGTTINVDIVFYIEK